MPTQGPDGYWTVRELPSKDPQEELLLEIPLEELPPVKTPENLPSKNPQEELPSKEPQEELLPELPPLKLPSADMRELPFKDPQEELPLCDLACCTESSLACISPVLSV